MYKFNSVCNFIKNTKSCPICNENLIYNSSLDIFAEFILNSNNILYRSKKGGIEVIINDDCIKLNNNTLIDSDVLKNIYSNLNIKLTCHQYHYSIDFNIYLDFNKNKLLYIEPMFEDIEYNRNTFLTDFLKERTLLISKNNIYNLPFYPLINYKNKISRLELLLNVA